MPPIRRRDETWEEAARRITNNPELRGREMIEVIDAIMANDERATHALSPDTFSYSRIGAAPMPMAMVTPGSLMAEFHDEVADAPSSEKKVKKMTPEIEKRLIVATDKLLKKEAARLSQMIPSNLGRREAEYHQLLLDEKKTLRTARELVGSEIPVHLDSSGVGGRLEEIAHLKLCRGVKMDARGYVVITCSECQLDISSYFAFFCVGKVFCAEHVPTYDMCALCKTLEDDCKPIKTYDNKEILVCLGCLHERRNCYGCGNRLESKYIQRGNCERCMALLDERHSAQHRFSSSLKWVSNDMGATIKSKRIYSTELEALSSNRAWADVLNRTLPSEMGIGTDGSVGVRGESPYGFEVQTPRLGGKKGEELIRRATSAIKELGAHVDHTCGMHVHLDGAGIMGSRRDYPRGLIQLLKSYVVMEDVIMSFLPYSRRRNDYCRPMSQSFQVVELDMIETVPEFEKLWYRQRLNGDISSAKGHHYHASRYFGANFHSLLANGHFEVRLHSGTLNPKKILEWINLHALLMDACAEGKMDIEFFKEYQATSRLGERTTLLFDKIGLAESSRQYFRTRQNKFGDKKSEDEEVQGEPKKKSRRQNIYADFSGFERFRAPLATTDMIMEVDVAEALETNDEEN